MVDLCFLDDKVVPWSSLNLGETADRVYAVLENAGCLCPIVTLKPCLTLRFVNDERTLQVRIDGEIVKYRIFKDLNVPWKVATDDGTLRAAVNYLYPKGKT